MDLKEENPKTPIFHLKPKIQKGNSERPAIISTDCRTSKSFLTCRLPPSTKD